MRKDEIEVGATYVNKGAGRTTRTVIAMGTNRQPSAWYGSGWPPDEIGVEYKDNRGKTDRLYLSSFAVWAGRKVIE